MATLADELHNDFLDSGSEGERHEDDEGASTGSQDPPTKYARNGDLEMGDELREADADDMDDGDSDGLLGEAEEETEARLQRERKEQAAPKDMRSVATFVKSMEPVLEVSISHCLSPDQMHRVYIVAISNPDVRAPPAENRVLSVTTTGTTSQERRRSHRR